MNDGKCTHSALGSVVALDEVVLDSVENVKPHGGSERLGTPVHLRVHVGFAGGSVTCVFGDVVGSH